jgi:hypothetical protein
VLGYATTNQIEYSFAKILSPEGIISWEEIFSIKNGYGQRFSPLTVSVYSLELSELIAPELL